MRAKRWMLVALALTAGAATGGPAAATTSMRNQPPAGLEAGGIGLRLVEVPVAAQDDPRARIYIVDHVAPGTTIHRQIEVSNTTASDVQVELYPAAAAIEDGAFVGAVGHTANDLSTWTAVSPDRPGIVAGGLLTATVSVAVPSDAAPGEQYGVMWAEVRSAPPSNGGVTQVNRVGIRLYVSVGPGAPPAADFTIDSLTAERATNGQPLVRATVHNTGGRALDMNGTLRLTGGPGGLSAGPFAAAVGRTLAIGATAPVTIALDPQLPAGPWRAEITLGSGLLERTAHATITFPGTGAAPPVKATADQHGGWLTGAALGIAAVVGLVSCIGASVVVLRRRRWSHGRDRSHRLREPVVRV